MLMLYSINENVRIWNWRSQTVGEDKISIAGLIDRVERGYYKTKKVDVDLSVYNLSKESFVCDNLFQFLTHYKLVENSNLEHPIILNNEGQVLDGRHRICKAILQGQEKIEGIMILDDSVI